ncbi:hypothetical protein [Gorillibacterium timonense]|uniref:hypothetical protein n=1 Tax=Gorillibacterium timonense TaxID=1689269 RepID=UPI00071DB59D|nr:hypothetical protein [Gorillibacterium timonense]
MAIFDSNKAKLKKGKADQPVATTKVQEVITETAEPVTPQITLDELVDAFLRKTKAWENKVQENLGNLRNQQNSLKEKINKQTRTALEHDLQDENEEAAKYRLANKDLRLELEEVEASISEFENHTVGKVDFTADIKVIQEAANRELHENIKAQEATFGQRAAIDLQIKELEMKKKQLAAERDRLDQFGPGYTVSKIVRFIYPAPIQKLSSYDREAFVRNWIFGEDISYYLPREESDEPRDILTTNYEIRHTEPNSEIQTARINSQKQSAIVLQEWKEVHPNAEIIRSFSPDVGTLEIVYKNKA